MMQTSIKYAPGILLTLLVLFAGFVWAEMHFNQLVYQKEVVVTAVMATTSIKSVEEIKIAVPPVWPEVLDIEDYDKKLLTLAGYVPPLPITVLSTSTNSNGSIIVSTTTTAVPSLLRYSSSTNVTVDGALWPKAAAYPNGGAVLPFKRILAYYGNFYSRQMGILGELEPEAMLERLAEAQAEWEKSDPTTPVLPAIEYIAMVAQAEAGRDGMYRAVMPDAEIEKAYDLAKKINGVMILDIQVGLSTLEVELPKFRKYLERPDVFFAIDPEFSMKGGEKPGTVIGNFNAADVNYVIDYLSAIVREKQLSPKVLIVHRFTQDMVREVSSIKPSKEVQVVMVMDGWGPKDLKRATYAHVIEPEPVQFSGLKIFYKNDLKSPSTGLLTPEDVLNLNPRPIYIQYQ